MFITTVDVLLNQKKKKNVFKKINVIFNLEYYSLNIREPILNLYGS